MGEIGRAEPLMLVWEDMHWADRSTPKKERSLRFIRGAIQLLDPETDPLLASRVYSTYAEMCHELADELGHLEAVDQALVLPHVTDHPIHDFDDRPPESPAEP